MLTNLMQLLSIRSSFQSSARVILLNPPAANRDNVKTCC